MINPLIREHTKNGEILYDVPSRLLKSRIIFISEPINSEVASMVCSLLLMLDGEKNDEKISIWLNCPGGEIGNFLAIYDMMNFVKSPIQTVCIGHAESAAALLLAAGSPGLRFATPNARIMIHQTQINGAFSESNTDFQITAAEVQKLNNTVNKILSRHTGKSLKKIVKDCERDLYLDASEAKNYGIIDKVMPLKKEIPNLLKK